MPELTTIAACTANDAVPVPENNPAPAAGGGGTIVPDDPADIPQITTYHNEYSGPAVVTSADIIATMGVTKLLDVDIFVSQVDAPGDEVQMQFGTGNIETYGLGVGKRFEAPTGYALDDFTITLGDNQAVIIDAEGV